MEYVCPLTRFAGALPQGEPYGAVPKPLPLGEVSRYGVTEREYSLMNIQ